MRALITVCFLFWREKVNLNHKNKFIATVLIVLTLTNIIIPVVNAFEYNIGDDIKLKGYGSVEQHLRNKENGDYMVTTDLVRLLFRWCILSCVLFKQR